MVNIRHLKNGVHKLIIGGISSSGFVKSFIMNDVTIEGDDLVALERFKHWAGTSYVDPSQLCSNKKQGEGPPKPLELSLFYVKSQIPRLTSALCCRIHA